MSAGQEQPWGQVPVGKQAMVGAKLDPLSPQSLQNEAVERIEQLDREIAEIEMRLASFNDDLDRRRHARQAIAASLGHLTAPDKMQDTPRG